MTSQIPDEDLSPENVETALLLAGLTVTQEQIARWTAGRQREAMEWALLEHLAASDNDVKRMVQPAWLAEVALAERNPQALRDARQAVTDYIRASGPEGSDIDHLLAHVTHRGHNVSRNTVALWIADLRSAGLAEPVTQGTNSMATCYRLIPDTDRAGAGEALRSAIREWDYEFTVHAGSQAPSSIQELFPVMATRVVMTFAHHQFASFRDGLAVCGLTLHEISRVPHFEPEIVL